ncbi:MAG: AAA family ATPase [Planctomycetota bacterium]
MKNYSNDDVKKIFEITLPKIENIYEQINNYFLGQSENLRYAICSILSGGHILIEGLPGLGKTLLAKLLSSAFNLEFSRIQFTPDLMPADITGTNILMEEDGRRTFQFQRGPIFTNFLLADEINRASPKTQSALLEAMQEGSVTVLNKKYELPRPFIVFATQNPIELEGTYPLPEAQLDRFHLKLIISMPDDKSLEKIIQLKPYNLINPVIKSDISKDELNTTINLLYELPYARQIIEVISKIVKYSNPSYSNIETVKKYVKIGASPRAAQVLLKNAQSFAFLNGRPYVSIEDIKKICVPVLRHRIIINIDGELNNITPEKIISDILEQI